MQKRDINDYTSKYLHSDYSFENVMVSIRRKQILGFLEQFKAKKILEIGCGARSICNFYKDFSKFVIIEPSSEFAKIAMNDCKNLLNLDSISDRNGGKSTKFIESIAIKSVEHLESKNSINYKDAIESKSVTIIQDFIENHIETLQKSNFDFIILSSLLHEVINPLDFLTQILSLLQNDTILHINVPNALSLHLLWAHKAGLLRNIGDLTPSAKSFQRHTTFTLQSLKDMIYKAFDNLDSINYQKNKHLEILQSGSYFIKPFNHPKMQECLNLNIIDSALLEGLEKMIEYLPEFGAEIFINAKIV